MDIKPQDIIFTDLDGTLLDFHSYSAELTQPYVQQLQEAGVPIIFCSSKTRAEQEQYRKLLQIKAPFIVENGSAIFIPKGYFDFMYPYQKVVGDYNVMELGTSAAEIRKNIQVVRDTLRVDYKGYADLEIEQIMELTGLDEESARHAANREYSETILTGDHSSQEFQRFSLRLVPYGLISVSGGKFHTVMGKSSNKGRAVKLLTDLFKRHYPQLMTSAIGDSANDAPMLRVVDRPYLVKKPGNKWEDIPLAGLKKVNGVGPKGWVKFAQGLLNHL